jgi:hypothetical protein
MAIAVQWDLKVNSGYNEANQGVRNIRSAWVTGVVAAAVDKLALSVQSVGVNIGDFHPSADQAAIGMVCVQRYAQDIQNSGKESMLVSVVYETSPEPIMDDGTTAQPWVVSEDGQITIEPYGLSATSATGKKEILIVRYRPPGCDDATWAKMMSFKIAGKYNPYFPIANQAAMFDKKIGLQVYRLRRKFSAKLGSKFAIQNWPAIYQTHLNKEHKGHTYTWKGSTLQIGPISVYSIDRGFRSMNVDMTIFRDDRGHDPFVAYGMKNGTMPPLTDASYISTTNCDHPDIRDPDHSQSEGDTPYGILRPFAYDVSGDGLDFWDPSGLDIGNCNPVFF